MSKGKEVLGGFDLVSSNLEDYSSNIEGVEVQVDPLQTSIEEAPSNLGNKKIRKWKLAGKTGDHTQITGTTTNLSKGKITAGQLANENSKKNYPSLIQRSLKNGGADICSPRSGLKRRDFLQRSQEDKAHSEKQSCLHLKSEEDSVWSIRFFKRWSLETRPAKNNEYP